VSVLPPPSEKATYVAGMFGRIASGYDRMNRLMTFGLDDWWRQIVVRDINPAPDATMLDIGSGTGPFLPILRRQAPRGIAIGADFVLPMMQSGLHRLDEHSAFVCADAQTLPFDTNTFDVVTAGFVIRNVSDIDACFREVLRVTKPGGRFAILEVARPQSTVIRWGHRMYFEEVMPRIAQLLGADPVAYRYLPESSRHFPDPPILADMLRGAGWAHVTYRHLPPHAVALHIATKSSTSELSHE